jgi:hypothetical protein
MIGSFQEAERFNPSSREIAPVNFIPDAVERPSRQQPVIDLRGIIRIEIVQHLDGFAAGAAVCSDERNY